MKFRIVTFLFVAAAAVGATNLRAGGDYYVSATGSGNVCSQAQPCSLEQAIAGTTGNSINRGTIGAGDTVRVAAGIYRTPPLDIKGNGSAHGGWIKIIGQTGTVLTGAREQAPAPAAWVKTSGRTYTYEVPWDDTAKFEAGAAEVATAGSCYNPIKVVDGSKEFTLDFAPRYKNVSSVAEVDAQSGTIFHDTANDKVYLHTYNDSAPAACHNLWFLGRGYGTLRVYGDYVWLEGLEFQYGSTNHLKVFPEADYAVLRNIKAYGTAVFVQGTNGVVENIRVESVISQGEPDPGCVDSNPGFGVNECWGHGGGGQAMVIGVDRSTVSYGNTVRRATIIKSWNSVDLRYRNTLEDSVIWGHPNHGISVDGDGGVIRRNIVGNTQESVYSSESVASTTNMRIVNNVFERPIVAEGQGNSNWVISHNIVAGIAYDERTKATIKSDCNLLIPRVAEQNYVVKWGSGNSYTTLAQIRSNTTTEKNSALLDYTKWTDGTQFVKFLGHASFDFDFRPTAGAVSRNICGGQIGPSFSSSSLSAPVGVRVQPS